VEFYLEVVDLYIDIEYGDCNYLSFFVRSFVLTLFIFKVPNHMLDHTLTERVV